MEAKKDARNKTDEYSHCVLDCTMYFSFIALVAICNYSVQQILGKLSFLPSQ